MLNTSVFILSQLTYLQQENFVVICDANHIQRSPQQRALVSYLLEGCTQLLGLTALCGA